MAGEGVSRVGNSSSLELGLPGLLSGRHPRAWQLCVLPGSRVGQWVLGAPSVSPPPAGAVANHADLTLAPWTYCVPRPFPE